MASTPIRASKVRTRRRSDGAVEPETRFDRRLGEILSHATEVFCEKGYAGASMRDLSRASGMSLAGLYHYFGSKERLLYLIQKNTFSTIVERLKTRLQDVTDPGERLRIFVQNHLEYFVTNQSGLKVLAHEDEALKNGFGSEIAAIKREYYRICLGLIDDLKHRRHLDFNSRTAVMSLFGMINWIYTWYNPRLDGTAEELADDMSAILLAGLGCSRPRNGEAATLQRITAHGASRSVVSVQRVKTRAGKRKIGDSGAGARRNAHAGR